MGRNKKKNKTKNMDFHNFNERGNKRPVYFYLITKSTIQVRSEITNSTQDVLLKVLSQYPTYF